VPAPPISPTTLAAIIIALSFAAGLNVYATVLSLGVLARLHWIALPDGLHAVADTWIMVASAILFAAELVADKIPTFDLVWNALHTFVRIPVAALMAYAVGQHLPRRCICWSRASALRSRRSPTARRPRCGLR
jgi:hypothetical protein